MPILDSIGSRSIELNLEAHCRWGQRSIRWK